jgi:hypothetical protein
MNYKRKEVAMSRRRYTVDFTEDLDRLIAEIAEEKGITKAEVIRRALTYYSVLQAETDNVNRKILITDKDDKVVKQLVFA